MSAATLPVEVWAIIIKKLDTKSICNLYETCGYFRNVICMQGVVRECQFSLNTLATVKSLKLDFFRGVSACLKILNLSGVSDLNKSLLISALKKLKNLSDLDISYTKIVMPDFLDIVKVTPYLENLAINFLFGKNYKVTKKLLTDYQQAFGGLKDVHFVGSISDLLFGKLVVHILRKAKLFRLNFTVCGDYYQVQNYDGDDWDSDEISLSQFRVYFIKEVLDQQLLDLPIFQSLDLNKYETVIFQVCMTGVVSVFATPVLKQLICANFGIEVEPLSNLFPVVVGEAAILLWDKDSIDLSTFYSKLLIILQEYLIFNLDGSVLVPVPVKYKWYCIKQGSQSVGRNNTLVEDLKFKKARIAQPNLVINYDEAFKEKKDNFKLIINFTESITKPVTLRNCDFFKRLSHLVLIGDIRYSPDFFKNLFEYCECLDTLQIMKYLGTMSNITILQYLPRSKRLKNILLHVSGLLVNLFKYLSECKTLENIHLVISRSLTESLPDPSDLFINCDNLYNVCIKLNEPNINKSLRMYKKIRSKLGKDFINIDMFPYSVRNNRYTPYFSVFNIYLKPLSV